MYLYRNTQECHAKQDLLVTTLHLIDNLNISKNIEPDPKTLHQIVSTYSTLTQLHKLLIRAFVNPTNY
jgi:maltose-binding protein MalE